jgi:hypothetical protein
MSKKSLKVPGKGGLLHVPQQGPYGERCSFSKTNGLSIHLYLSESPVKNISHEMRGKYRSPSTEPHVEGSPTYSGVRPGPTRGSLTTLLSLPQCHAAFSTLPPTLVWVDQGPVSQRFVVTLNSVYPPHLLQPPTWPRVERITKPRNHEVQTRGWIYGRWNLQ